MTALFDSLALSYKACFALLFGNPKDHYRARSMSHSGKAVEPTSAALGCPSAEVSDQQLRVPSSPVQRWHVLGCGAPAHPVLLVLCPEDGASAQHRVWTQGHGSSLNPFGGRVNVAVDLPSPSSRARCKFLFGNLLFGLALGRLLIQILFQRNAIREGLCSWPKKMPYPIANEW